MKILNKLTLKHLSKNKKRTIVSIIGVILSTALMVGIGLLISSSLYTNLEEVKVATGGYHTALMNDDVSHQLEYKNIKFVDKVDYINDVGYARIEPKSDNYQSLLYIQSFSEDFFKRVRITEGTYPRTSDEILLSEDTIDSLKNPVKIGDSIILDVGSLYDYESNAYQYGDVYFIPGEFNVDQKDLVQRKFKIVGFMYEPLHYSSHPVDKAYTFIDLDHDHVINPYLTYDKANKTNSYNQQLSSIFDIEPYDFMNNSWLLRYYGVFGESFNSFRTVINILFILMLAILSVGCATVIYNSFSISTLERKKQFGLYASVGTTKKQIRDSVYLEAVIIGGIGIILGVLSGFVGIFITLKVINSILASQLNIPFVFKPNWLYVVLPILFMVVVIVISAYFPAKKASKITPIEAIKQTSDIKTTRKDSRSSWLMKKMDVNLQLAIKNMRRNKGKHRTTTISLFISIVMFISFSTFGEYLKKSISLVDRNDYDVKVNVYSDKEETKKKVNSIFANADIKESLNLKTYSYIVDGLDRSHYTEDYLNSAYGELFDDTYESTKLAEVFIVTNEKYSEYLKDVGATENQIIVLNSVVDDVSSQADNKIIELEMFNDVDFTVTNLEFLKSMNDSYEHEISLSNFVLTDHQWFGFSETRFSSSIPIIMSMDIAESYGIVTDQEYLSTTFLKTYDYESITKDISNLKHEDVHVYSPRLESRNAADLFLSAKILIYGFITLVTLIGVTSVFNTIYSNVMLRRKEFAVLRSVGMDAKGLSKMLFYEMFLVGLRALLIAIPVSIGMVCLINLIIGQAISFADIIIPYRAIIIAIVAVFILVFLGTSYSKSLIRDDNILESMRIENI